jgi:hypothetical protein
MIPETGTDYCSELYLQTAVRTDTRINQLSMDMTTLTTSCQAQLIPMPTPRVDDHQQIVYCQPGRVVDDEDQDHRNMRKRPRFSRSIPMLSFSLIVPRWLTQYSLQISVCRAAQNWTLNLKLYRTVPDHSELEVAIYRADLNEVRHLVESGQATVYDRNEHGQTALHVCFLQLDAALTLTDLIPDGSNFVLIRTVRSELAYFSFPFGARRRCQRARLCRHVSSAHDRQVFAYH